MISMGRMYLCPEKKKRGVYAPRYRKFEDGKNQEAENFNSLIASKFWTPPPTRLVV